MEEIINSFKELDRKN